MMIALLLAFATQADPPVRNVSLSSITGGWIVRECTESPGPVNDFCTGFILGVADALQFSGDTCRPHSDIATRQTYEVAKRYIQAHPERWNQTGFSLVRTALIDAFPCRPRRP